MAEKNPPRWMQSGEHDAEIDRRMISALMGRRGGIVGAEDLKVWQQTVADMSVRAATGAVFVPGTETGYQGVYYCENQNASTIPIAASDPTNPRIDYIVARVYDQEYSGTESRWAIEAITGTPAASPTAPAVPANSWVLAQVTVGAGVTSILDANIVNLRAGWGSAQRGRAAALGGIITATSGGRPILTAADEGAVIYETDTNRVVFWDGATWRGLGAAAVPRIPDLIDGGVAAATNTTAQNLIARPSLFTAPVPLRMDVELWGHAGASPNDGNQANLFLQIRDEAGNSIGTGGFDGETTTVSSFNFKDRMSITGYGSKTYQAGQTVGFHVAYWLDRGSIYCQCRAKVSYYALPV